MIFFFFFGCVYGELKAKRFTYFDDSMKKNKISINILDVVFFMNVLFFQWEQKILLNL